MRDPYFHILIFLTLNAVQSLLRPYIHRQCIQKMVVKDLVHESNKKCNEPQHIAFICDGNGRWAEEKQLVRLEGHKKGASASVDIINATFFENDIDYITLFLFSTENWSRPLDEITNIMILLENYLDKFEKYFKANKIRLLAIGQLHRLSPSVIERINKAGYKEQSPLVVKGDDTSKVKTLTLAISYGGRDDIVESCKHIIAKVSKGEISVNEISIRDFASATSTGLLGVPDPDMIIRTSGEKRLSNFMLFQSAYSELFFLPKYWPDLTKDDIKSAIDEFKSRKRRFGK